MLPTAAATASIESKIRSGEASAFAGLGQPPPQRLNGGYGAEEAAAFGCRRWPPLSTLSGGCGTEEAAALGCRRRPPLPTLSGVWRRKMRPSLAAGGYRR